jgi:hypothetical protein
MKAIRSFLLTEVSKTRAGRGAVLAIDGFDGIDEATELIYMTPAVSINRPIYINFPPAVQTQSI